MGTETPTTGTNAEFWRDPRTGEARALVDGRNSRGKDALEEMRRWNHTETPQQEQERHERAER